MNNLIEQIKNCLKQAGMMDLPGDNGQNLEDYGLDSLIRALTIVEVERAFSIKIPLEDVDQNTLKSINDFRALCQKKIDEAKAT